MSNTGNNLNSGSPEGGDQNSRELTLINRLDLGAKYANHCRLAYSTSLGGGSGRLGARLGSHVKSISIISSMNAPYGAYSIIANSVLDGWVQLRLTTWVLPLGSCKVRLFILTAK